ncbi:MAG: 50S ribosomal protein L30 [archaeon]
MIAAIRISGMVGVDWDVEATLGRMRLGRKYSCSLLKTDAESLGMIKKARAFIAYGKIDKETLKQLILKRGKMPGDKPVSSNISDSSVEEIFSGKKNLKDFGMKPFFRLHPPIGGFKKSTNQFYPKGILGNHNDKINALIRRML